MPHPTAALWSTARRGLRPGLLAIKLLGVVAVLGGFAALSALRFFGPAPQTQDEWRLLVAVIRAVFFPCVLAGMLVVVASGLVLLALRWRTLLRRRWFRLKVLILVVSLPSLHLWGRSRMLALYAAVDGERLDEAQRHWNEAGAAFLTALVVLLVVAGVGRAGARG